MPTIQDLIDVAVKVKDQLASSLNPVNYLEKLLDSHEFKNKQQDATDFLYQLSIHTDDFFSEKNMPAQWSHRTYSSSMEALSHVLQDPSLKSKLVVKMGDDEYASLMEVITTKKRFYMNEVKKESRKKKKDDFVEENASVEEVSNPPAASQLVASEIQDFNTANQGGTGNATPSDKNDGGDEGKDGKKLKKHVHHLKYLLERYADIETDPFKRLILELVQKEVHSISTLT